MCTYCIYKCLIRLGICKYPTFLKLSLCTKLALQLQNGSNKGEIAVMNRVRQLKHLVQIKKRSWLRLIKKKGNVHKLQSPAWKSNWLHNPDVHIILHLPNPGSHHSTFPFLSLCLYRPHTHQSPTQIPQDHTLHLNHCKKRQYCSTGNTNTK